MAISYVGEAASVSSASSANATEPVTVVGNRAAGNTIYLIHGIRVASSAGITITDSRSNTWTIDSILVASNNLVFIASTRQDGGTLQNNDVVTIHYTTVPGSGRMSVLEEFSGLSTGSYSDGQNTSSTASATNLTTGALTTTNANDLMIAAWITGTNASTLTYNNTGTIGTYLNFTTTKLTTTSGFSKDLGMCYQIVSSAAAQASNMLMNATNSMTSAFTATKATAAASTYKSQNLPTLGVG